jgi:hypothetical protein
LGRATAPEREARCASSTAPRRLLVLRLHTASLIPQRSTRRKPTACQTVAGASKTSGKALKGKCIPEGMPDPRAKSSATPPGWMIHLIRIPVVSPALWVQPPATFCQPSGLVHGTSLEPCSRFIGVGCWDLEFPVRPSASSCHPWLNKKTGVVRATPALVSYGLNFYRINCFSR